MRHGVKTNKLNRTVEHRRMMLRNLATSVIEKGLSAEQIDRQVRTTYTKAMYVRSLVERLVTYAKKGDLSARRQAARFVTKPEVLQGLFTTIGPRYKERNGGYSRVLKMGRMRAGDAAEMAMISLVEDTIVPKAKPVGKKKSVAKAAKVDIVASSPVEAAAEGSEKKEG